MHSAWRAKGSRAPFSPLSNNVGSPPRPATKSAAPGVCDASHVALLIGTPFRSVATSGAGGAALAGFAGSAAAAATASWARRAASGFAGSHRRGAASAAVEVAAQTQIAATILRRLCMLCLSCVSLSSQHSCNQRPLVAGVGCSRFFHSRAELSASIESPGGRVWGCFAGASLDKMGKWRAAGKGGAHFSRIASNRPNVADDAF